MTRARYAPISDPDITEYNGLRWSAGAAAGALPEPASSRAAHPVPPCPLRTILTSNDPPENGKTGFLKFLELCRNHLAATSTWLPGPPAWHRLARSATWAPPAPAPGAHSGRAAPMRQRVGWGTGRPRPRQGPRRARNVTNGASALRERPVRPDGVRQVQT